MSRRAFHFLLERYLLGACTPEEEEMVKQWYDLLDQDQAADLADVSFEELEARLWEKINSETAFKKKDKRAGFIFGKWARVAAVSVLFMIGLGLWVKWKIATVPVGPQFLSQMLPETVLLQNTTKEEKIVQLPDSSQVTLYPGSSIHYPKSFTHRRREVVLKGDALFSVKANASNPFWVFHEGLITRVLGTVFLVKSAHHADQEEVVVYAGKVEVIKKEPKEDFFRRYLMAPEMVHLSINQRAILEQVNAELKETLVEHPIPVAGWDKQVHATTFHEIRLADLAKQLGVGYGIDIQINDRLRDITFTGDLTGMGLYKQLEFICGVTQSAYQINGKAIIIQ